jgi:hypothetical protein
MYLGAVTSGEAEPLRAAERTAEGSMPTQTLDPTLQEFLHGPVFLFVQFLLGQKIFVMGRAFNPEREIFTGLFRKIQPSPDGATSRGR